MPFDLTSITAGKICRPPILGIAGVPGIGKTTFAAAAPSPIFIPTEDGSGEVNVSRFPKATKLEEVLEAIRTLGTTEHPYQTVVLDSLDHLEPLIWEYTCRTNGKASIEAFGYGKGYIEALTGWRTVFDGLIKLRDRKGMGVIVISHVQVKRFEDPNSDGYDRYMPKLHKAAADLAVEHCDAWGFANWDISVVTTTNEDRKRGVSQGKRIIWWEERPSHWAKNRFNLPAKMDLSWAAFNDHMTKTKEGT